MADILMWAQVLVPIIIILDMGFEVLSAFIEALIWHFRKR